jgi:hypothetical protein
MLNDIGLDIFTEEFKKYIIILKNSIFDHASVHVVNGCPAGLISNSLLTPRFGMVVCCTLE